MRARYLWFLSVIFALIFSTGVFPAAAQLRTLQCGSIEGGEFVQDAEAHVYEIQLNAGDAITVSGIGGDSDLLFHIALYEPGGVIIAASTDLFITGSGADAPRVSTPSIRTSALSATGVYSIRAFNGYYDARDLQPIEDGENDAIGEYQLQVACTLADGTPVPAGAPVPYSPLESSNITISVPVIRTQSVTPMSCGQIIASEFSQLNQVHRYSLDIEGDDQAFWATVTPVGDYLHTMIAVFDPTNELIAQSPSSYLSVSPSAQVDNVPRGGTYEIIVANQYQTIGQSGYRPYDLGNLYLTNAGGLGVYSFGVGCRLADGTTLNPGDTLLAEQPIVTAGQAAATPVAGAALPTALPTAIANCPGSPTPRLTIGLQGQVTPGDTNNVRPEPTSSTVVGQIPGGEQFTVLDGPQCGLNGLTFWQVQYGDLIGWTAEGQGNDYWLEPLESGRG